MTISEMNADLLSRIENLSIWTRGDQRAPHKPLLLLWALGRIQQGQPRLATYAETAGAVDTLLLAYGSPTKTETKYPFWYLKNDDLWVVPSSDGLPRRGQNKEPLVSAMLEAETTGGLRPDDHELLANDPNLLNQVVAMLLDRHFPPSLHEELRQACDIEVAIPGQSGPSDGSERGQKRDPGFRHNVLRAYAYRCAVCGYDGMLGGHQIGLEAAHVMWRHFQGPSSTSNGIALCPLHHKLLDLGAWGLTEDLRLCVSSHLHGSTESQAILTRHAGAPLLGPQQGELPVASIYREWHFKKVFKGPARPF